MAIECYKAKCIYHSIHLFPEDGPFCYEAECVPVILSENLIKTLLDLGWTPPPGKTSNET